MATYVIADLHLSKRTPDTCAAFQKFVESLSHNDLLIISGDLFEFFVGRDPHDEVQQFVRKVLHDAQKRGIKCGFQRGNRDFLIRKSDASYFHFTLLPDFYVIQTVDGSCLVMHGDDLCTNDKEYMKFKRRVRQPCFRWFFMAMPLSWRKKTARKMRAKSRKQVRRDENIYGVVTDTVKEYAQKYEAKILIHGHFHAFGKHFGEAPGLKSRLALGAWAGAFSYARIDRNGIAFVQKNSDLLIKGKKHSFSSGYFVQVQE